MSLYEKLIAKEAVLAVVGLGYVGMPIAVAFAKKGLNVIGFDTNSKKIEAYCSGADPTKEVGDEQVRNTTVQFTDEEQQLLSEPIDRWGKAWQKFMTENYPEEIPSMEGRLKWELIPRQIDKEAWEMWELLRKQYAEKNPRPKTTFTEIERWEKTRSFIVEHEVMEQIVLQRRG